MFDLNIYMDYESMLGELIGTGASRFVYKNLHDLSTVVKVQRPKTFKKNVTLNNVMEWHIWNRYLNSAYQHLLCPCMCISEDGKYLVQTFAEVLAPGKHLKRSRAQWQQLPVEIQRYADSRWYKNWGRLEDRYVMIDYGREHADRI